MSIPVPLTGLTVSPISSQNSSPRHSTGSWLSRDVKILKQHGCKILVSCCEEDELKELGLLENFANELRLHQVQFVHFPIQKYIPRIPVDDFIALTAKLASIITEEESVVVIHSDSGKGRSALVAAGILVNLGYTQKEAIELLVSTDNQTLSNPLFYGYLSLFSSRIKRMADSEIPNGGERDSVNDSPRKYSPRKSRGSLGSSTNFNPRNSHESGTKNSPRKSNSSTELLQLPRDSHKNVRIQAEFSEEQTCRCGDDCDGNCECGSTAYTSAPSSSPSSTSFIERSYYSDIGMTSTKMRGMGVMGNATSLFSNPEEFEM